MIQVVLYGIKSIEVKAVDDYNRVIKNKLTGRLNNFLKHIALVSGYLYLRRGMTSSEIIRVFVRLSICCLGLTVFNNLPEFHNQNERCEVL